MFHCKNPYGYNCTDGGEETIGYIHTTEQRAKAAKSRLGNKNHLGKHHTDETRVKMSAAKKGRKGKSPSTETRTRIAVAQTGKKYTAETLLKISEKKRQDAPYENLSLKISKRSLTYAALAQRYDCHGASRLVRGQPPSMAAKITSRIFFNTP